MIRFFTRLFVFFVVTACVFPTAGFSQVTLGASPYTETFDNIGSGLPTGFSIYSAATATSLVTPATLTTAATAWSNVTGAFKNFASADGLFYNSTSTAQSASTDRALGVRQTAAVGDPGAAFVFQAANTTGKTGFKLAFKLQSLDSTSPRLATWIVQYGFGTSPSVYTTVPVGSITGTLTTGGGHFTNYADTADFGSALDNQSQVITIRIVTLTATSGSGNRPSSAIDDFSLIWGTGTSVTPTIILNNNGATAIQFPSTAVSSTSIAQTYTVNATNLTAPLSISTAAPFMVSSNNTAFFTSLSLTPDVNGTVASTIYTNFTPSAVGVVNGTILNSSTGATSKSVTLSGEGIDPNALSFNFNTCTNLGVPGSGFYAYNVTGPQVWTCTSFGNNSTNGVNMNGYLTTAVNNEDWLISPPLKIGGLATPVLSFYSKGEYSGPILQLLASTNYDGISNPDSSKFVWTPLNGNFLTPSGGTLSTFNFSDNINLSAYKSAPNLYLAFKYVSDTIQGAARWTLDDINISDRSTLFSVSPIQLVFGETPAAPFSYYYGSAPQTVFLQSLGHKDVTITAPAEFQVSLDASNYSSAILIDSVTAKVGRNFYVRFSPTIKAIKETGLLHFTATGLDTSFVALSGSSYPKSETMDIACYNMSFFGSNDNNDATPASTNLKKTNIETVYQHLNADIIGVEEVSNDSVFNKFISDMPGYAGFLSPRWSYFFQPFNESLDTAGYPPQKTGFVYNTKTVKFIDSHVIDGAQYDSVRAGTLHIWTDYPTGDPTSFYSSGRMPLLATFDVTIGGITKRIRMVDIHAKALGDATSYARRVYDAKVLKDTLDKYYANDNVIIVGDFNDRLVTSIYLGTTVSPYTPFVTDKADYKALTYSLDSAGKSSFPGDVGMIDQIICSNELIPSYIPNSTDIEPANTYIPNYGVNTASDHLPVFARFAFESPSAFTGCPNTNLAIARPGYNTYNGEPLNIYMVDTATGATTLLPGGPLKNPYSNNNVDVNGFGLNNQDGYLYGIIDSISSNNYLSIPMPVPIFVRVGSNYGIQSLGTLPEPPNGVNYYGVNIAAGCNDDQGNYYFTAMTAAHAPFPNSSAFVLTGFYLGKVSNVQSLAINSLTVGATWTAMDFSGANCSDFYSNVTSPLALNSNFFAGTKAAGLSDFTYSKIDNKIYAYVAFESPVGSGVYKGQLLSVDPTTGKVNCYPETSPLPFAGSNTEVAGIYTTANGSLEILFTNGDIYKTVMSSLGTYTGAITKVGSSGISPLGVTGSIRGDLASCGFGHSVAPPQVINPSLPQGVIAYPNPARGMATISTTNILSNATVSLIGLAGNIISQTSGVSGNTFQLNLTNTASGVYVVEINQNGNISRVKIVKE